MKTILGILWVATTVTLSAQNADTPLDAAKTLYLSASYQEALTTLDGVHADAQIDEAEKYRALCLLGLDRPTEAEDAIEHLLERRPLFALDPQDSPKLQAMFTDARARVLPAAATSLYATAKASFDRGELATAVEQFGVVVKVLSQPEVEGNPSMADLKVLANGFASLADGQLASQRKLAQTALRATAASPPSAPAAERIYSDADPDVIPPVAIAQEVPQWLPPTDQVRSMTFVGALEIVVDEHGNVTDATITHPTLAPYDELLLVSTKRWRYRPASYAGHAVKYRKTVRVHLQPPSNRG